MYKRNYRTPEAELRCLPAEDILISSSSEVDSDDLFEDEESEEE